MNATRAFSGRPRGIEAKKAPKTARHRVRRTRFRGHPNKNQGLSGSPSVGTESTTSPVSGQAAHTKNMTHALLSKQLQQLEAQRADQDATFAAVRTALEGLNERSLIQVAHTWTEAFETATEPRSRCTHASPVNALRG